MKFFFLFFIFILQFYLLSLFSFIATIPEVVVLVFTFGVALYRPLWSLSLFFVVLPLFFFSLLECSSGFLIGLSAAILLGIYSNLLLRHPVRLKRFVVKSRFSSIPLVLFFFYFIILLLALVGQPLYSLYEELFVFKHFYVLYDLFNVTPYFTLYPLKATLMIVEAMLFGMYVFGIVKPSNQVRVLHHLILAIVFGLVGSFVMLLFLHLQNKIFYVQYLILTLPLLPVILLVHKMNLFYIMLIGILLFIGSLILLFSMQLDAIIIFPFNLLIILMMIIFIVRRIKRRKESFIEFLHRNYKQIFLTFASMIILLLMSLSFVTNQIKSDNTLSKEFVETYLIQQSKRDRVWSLGTDIFLLNPLYGTGFNSFIWKAEKLKKLDVPKLSLNNLYLEILIGSGFIGLIFFLSIVVLVLYKLVRKEFSNRILSTENSILILMIFTALFSALIYANVANIFNYYPIILIFFLLLFMGLSLIHSYSVLQIQRYRAKKFFLYISYLLVYLFIIHILNFTVIKEYISSLLISFFPTFKEEYILNLMSYLFGVMIFAVLSSFFIHTKIIFYSRSDDYFLDKHSADKAHAVHTTPTPRVGGIGIYLANIFLIFNPLGWKLFLISLGSFVIGLVDDIHSVSPVIRLLFQGISALLAIYFLHAIVSTVGFGIVLPFWLGVLISFITIVGVINAFNIIDGFNGLSSGVAFLAYISLVFVSFELKDMLLFEISIINLLALLGFLLLNFPWGKIFLGDSGAYFIGFSLATVLLMLINRHQEVSVYYALALLIYPVWEVLFSMYRRKIVKKSKVTKADKQHLHQLIFKRVTRDNPKTTLYIIRRLLPFFVVTTLFYDNDLILLVLIVLFMVLYNYLYKRVIKFL